MIQNSIETTSQPAEKTKMTLVVFTADRWEHVCPIERITGPAEQAGLQVVHGSEWVEGQLKIFPERIAGADLVILQRDFPSYDPAYEQVMGYARAQGKFVVYELDDLLPELPDQHPDVNHYLVARSAIIRAIVEADAAVGSTPSLCDYLRTYNPNTWLLPNYLNDQFWKLQQPPRRTEEPVVVGYLGGHSHSYDLAEIAPALERILQRYGPRIQMKFWGVPPAPNLLPYPNVEWVDVGLVSYQQFAEFFMQQTCDLFIAPLQDNLFNRCKSHLKFLEYGALGVPGVYGRVTPYESIVIDGENGFLASSPAEWEARLAELIENPSLRHRLGAAAQETVQAGWLLSDHAGEWAEVYRQMRLVQKDHDQAQAPFHLARRMHDWQKDLEQRVASQEKRLIAQQRAAAELQQALDGAQNQIRILNALNEEKQQTITHIYDLYYDVLHSRGWRILQSAFRVRQKLLPSGSRRAGLAGIGIHSLRVLKNEGGGSFLRYIGRAGRDLARREPVAVPAPNAGPAAKPSIVSGVLLSAPALSLILRLEAGQEAPSPIQVQNWMAHQTVAPLLELLVWDEKTGAILGADAAGTRPAATLADVLAAAAGPYVALASFDLLQQAETYCETNLMALETERLAFTVNLRGNCPWAFDRLQAGWLPGNTAQPLLRMVARKEFLQAGFSLDLTPRLNQGHQMPQRLGKVLQHTTNFNDQEQMLPFEQRMPAGDWTLQGQSILFRTDPSLPWNAAGRLLQSLDSVLPAVPTSTDLPTVFVIHPFLAVGGAETHCLKVMRALQDRVRFVVVTFDPLDPAQGTTADDFRKITPYVYTLPDILDPALNHSLMVYLFERFGTPVLWICNGSPWIYDGLPELKKAYPALRVINQVYDYRVGWINRYDLALALNLDGHLGVNGRICQAYIEKGARPDQVYLIENGVEPEELPMTAYTPEKVSLLKRKLGLPEDKKLVVFASRVHPQKRPLDFLELARRFENDPSVAFLMVGDGPLGVKVDEQLASLGLKNFFRHRFYRPISDIFAICDCFVLPSDFEGMPMVIIEAQAMGKPVVVTDVGNNREVLDFTQGGIVTNQIGDINALMNGVRQMLAHPPEPEALRERTLSRYDIAIVAEKYYRSFMGEKGDYHA